MSLFSDFYSGKQVFVTGADGFIGSHLVEALVSNGAEVKALSQYNSFGTCGWLDSLSPKILDNVKICSGDIRDKGFIKNLVESCEVGFHLAALIGIPYSYTAPRSYVDTNIIGTLNVLDVSRELSNLETLVVTSTSEVYGTALKVPISEDHPMQGQSPYSATKIAADHLAESYYKSFNLPVSIIRPFNTFGPRQSMRAFIPTLITQALSNKSIKLGNLEPTRDFNFVLDTVKGFLLLGKNKASIGEVINIGSGKEISLKEVIKVVEDKVGLKLDIEFDESRVRPESSEVYRLWADISKSKSIIDYSPDYTFEKGIEETISWIKLNNTSLSSSKYFV